MEPFYQLFLLFVLTLFSDSKGDIFGSQNLETSRGFTLRLSRQAPADDADDADNNGQDPNYPYEQITQFVENSELLKQYFAVQSQLPPLTASRQLSAEPEQLCAMREEKVLYPQRRKNINQEWKTVVNIAGKFEQGFVQKACVNAGSQCKYADSLPFGYSSQCEQEFVTTQFVVFNSSSAFDLFRIPSCCSCKVKSTA